MEETIFKKIELDNDQTLVILDKSRKIGEDAYVVIMGVRMAIRIHRDLFAENKVSDAQFDDIREVLGDEIRYEYKSERNMIMASEKDQVFEELVATFLKNMMPYIAMPIFPEKKALKEYRERVEKKNKYR
ncbi:MAG: hypothetical protein KKC20_23530 [Proteobacteria bacterium]|nr:hypothetical protein [Pseudomonadota bacterium]